MKRCGLSNTYFFRYHCPLFLLLYYCSRTSRGGYEIRKAISIFYVNLSLFLSLSSLLFFVVLIFDFKNHHTTKVSKPRRFSWPLRALPLGFRKIWGWSKMSSPSCKQSSLNWIPGLMHILRISRKESRVRFVQSFTPCSSSILGKLLLLWLMGQVQTKGREFWERVLLGSHLKSN